MVSKSDIDNSTASVVFYCLPLLFVPPSFSGNDVTIDVAWSKHFINKIIEDNKLLYRVDSYPIQFKEIQDDGILYSQK
jgi:hypothetical protein